MIVYSLYFLVVPILAKQKIDREEALKQLDLGSKLLSQGQFSEALSSYHNAVELDPSNYQSFYRRATTYLAIGRPAQALADLEEVLRLKNDFSGARVQKANVLLKTGDLDAAEKEFQFLNEQNSEFDEKLELIENLRNLRDVLPNTGCDELEQVIEPAMEAQIWDPSIYRLRAKCYEENNELKKAVHDLKHAIKLTPDAMDLMFDTSQILFKIGDMKESLNSVCECLRLNPDHRDCYPFYKKIKKTVKFLESMQSSIEKQDWEKCVETEKKALAAKDQSDVQIVVAVYKLSCKCNREIGDTEKAIRECTKVIEEDEDGMVEALVERAEAYIVDGDWESAISDYERALELEPQNEEVKKGLEQAKRSKTQAGKRDYYKILGVKRTANKREITKAYRKLAQKWHPDNFNGEEEKKRAEKKFIDIASAKEVLTDEDKRRQFDAGRDPLDPEASSRGGGGGSHGFPHGFNPFGGRRGRNGDSFFFNF